MGKIVLCIFAILFATIVNYSESDNSDINIAQAIFGRSKKLFIDKNMELDDKEKNSFWHMYDQYEEKRKGQEKAGFLFKGFRDKYQTSDDAEAHKLNVNFMKSMDGSNTLHKVYFKKWKSYRQFKGYYIYSVGILHPNRITGEAAKPGSVQ